MLVYSALTAGDCNNDLVNAEIYININKCCRTTVKS